METTSQNKAKIGLEKQEHLIKLAILTTAAILCKLSNSSISFWGYTPTALYFYLYIGNSICYTPFFRIAVRKCHPWVRSILQLQNYSVSDWGGILQFPQLVRWSSMVSAGQNYRRNHLSWINGHFCCTLSANVVIEHHHRHPKCLRVFGTILFVSYCCSYLFADQRNSCK